MILQRYLRRWSDELAGALLTARRTGDPAAPAPAERPSPNARFEPSRTPYDWLTRDESEVDRYIADPLCGFEIMRSAPGGGRGPSRTGTTPGKVSSRLPILVFNGADDPIGGEAGGVALADHYRAQGVEDVTFRAYPGARHELFNELERDQVRRDVLAWLDART
jgi:alpha-beta hydrolase superfamily lysophospholipase